MLSEIEGDLSTRPAALKVARAATRRAWDLLSGIRRKCYGPITQVKTRSNYVALTFDDGPHPEYTVELLGILDRFGAKATFFMIGQNAVQYPRIVQMVAESGHTIGNHSHTHSAFPRLSSRVRKTEIQRCAEALHPYAKNLFRPPYGLENLRTHYDATRLGYRVIQWNISVSDWRERSADSIAEDVLDQIKAGSIVLLHDGSAGQRTSNQKQTLRAVEKILSTASAKFEFCTIPRLLAAGRPMTSFRAA